MIYTNETKGVHTLLQSCFIVSIFESHLKHESDHYFKKIQETIDKIKTQHKNDRPVLYVVRDEKSKANEYYKNLCHESKQHNMLSIAVQWDKGKNAGMQAFNEMLNIAHLSICLFDGTNRLENTYMSIVDPFKTINYVLYTGLES